MLDPGGSSPNYIHSLSGTVVWQTRWLTCACVYKLLLLDEWRIWCMSRKMGASWIAPVHVRVLSALLPTLYTARMSEEVFIWIDGRHYDSECWIIIRICNVRYLPINGHLWSHLHVLPWLLACILYCTIYCMIRMEFISLVEVYIPLHNAFGYTLQGMYPVIIITCNIHYIVRAKSN